jgi:hypothetical protein
MAPQLRRLKTDVVEAGLETRRRKEGDVADPDARPRGRAVRSRRAAEQVAFRPLSNRGRVARAMRSTPFRAIDCVGVEQLASAKSVSRRLTSHNLVGFHIDAGESAVTLSRGPTPTASTSRIRSGNRAVPRRWPLEINDLTVLLDSLPKMSNSFRLSTNASLF